MFFSSPLWLIGLVPWGALLIWVLRGRPKVEGVPFLALWKTTAVRKRVDPAWSRPPLALLSILLAMLLGLLAAAGPAVRNTTGRSITLIIDRGESMSRMGLSKPRFIEAVDRLDQVLPPDLREVRLVDVVNSESEEIAIDALRDRIARFKRTAIDTKDSLRSVVFAELNRDENPIILISDASLQIADTRFTQVVPPDVRKSAGISAIAARELPTPQVMVSVRNDSDTVDVHLQVASGENRIERTIQLPSRGEEGIYFFDLPKLGDVITANLKFEGEPEADQTAWLVREKQSARIEVRAGIPEPLRRMIDSYSKAKPPAKNASTLVVVNHAAELAEGENGVIADSGVQRQSAVGELRVDVSPVTSVVNWPEVIHGGWIAGTALEGWQPIVRVGDKTAIAVRDGAVKKIWVGLDSPRWARSVDYVVFWTNVFDWLNGSSQTFASHPVRLDPNLKPEGSVPANVQASLWPGVYTEPDGGRVAMNAFATAPRSEMIKTIGAREIVPMATNRLRSFTSILCIAAIFCVLVSAIAWPGSSQ